MGKYASVIIFVVLAASSGLASIGSYRAMETMIVDDLNRALELTVAEKRDGWMTNDTIRAYRSLQATMEGSIALNADNGAFCRHLTIPELRRTAYIRLDIPQAHGHATAPASRPTADGLCSDTIVWSSEALDANISVRGHARISAASVFMMSDQRFPLALSIAAMMWAAASLIYFRRKNTEGRMMPAIAGEPMAAGKAEPATACPATGFGGLTLSPDGNTFYDAGNRPVRLTPMQHRLMRMFFESPSLCLTKQEICDALWPKKEDASDTLYTLIKRLKPVLEAGSSLRIEAERGRAYRLTAAGKSDSAQSSIE